MIMRRVQQSQITQSESKESIASLEHKKERRELQIFIPSFVYLAWAEKSVIEKPRK